MNTCPICRKAVVIPGDATSVRCPSCGTLLKRKERPSPEVKQEVQSLQHKTASSFASVLEREERQASPVLFSPILEIESSPSSGAEVRPPRSNYESRRPKKTYHEFHVSALLDDAAGWFLSVALALGAIFWLLNFAFGVYCLASARTIFDDMTGMAAITGSLQATMLYAILWRMPARRRTARK